MSTQRGIFETFPNQAPPAGAPPVSPSGIAPAATTQSPQSPFMAAAARDAKKESPFSSGKEEADEKSSHLPERRKPPESPFQIAEPHGFGFEAPQQSPQAFSPSPFEQAPKAEIVPAPAAAPAPQQPAPVSGSHNSDSDSIKQLELRAIFGVDREMAREEIIQRLRSLPGIRQIALVSEQDIAAVDALKQVISNLGFGNGALKLYTGSVPIEFIREGRTLLAVQTDGGFAPGVRETLILVARELGK